MSLNIMEFADFELLRTIEKEPPGTTKALAETLDREVRGVASRLAWMRRMGFVDRTIAQNWIVTRKGENFLSSDLVPETRKLVKRATSPAIQWAVRREVRRNLG